MIGCISNIDQWNIATVCDGGIIWCIMVLYSENDHIATLNYFTDIYVIRNFDTGILLSEIEEKFYRGTVTGQFFIGQLK